MGARSTKPEDTWQARRASAAGVRVVVLVVPFVSSLVAARLLSSVVPTPAGFVHSVGRWLLIGVAATVVLLAVERQLRRLLPLAALLKLSLTFPDRAPSRVKIALRTGSTTQLRQRIEDAKAGRLGDTPVECATRILELVAALNIHDRLTRGHSERVRAYSEAIGAQMKLSPAELDRLRWAGLLHDIGKLMVPSEILNKKGRLTDEEFDVIKLHPEYGQVLVAPLTPWLGEASRAVWEHHERWEGGGYPRGIAGEDIALEARIVSVADTYDVITSVRSYKSRSSGKAARAELARCAGTQFDPQVVRAFLQASVRADSQMTAPAAWLAHGRVFPASLASNLARVGVVAGGTVGGLTVASGVFADDRLAEVARERAAVEALAPTTDIALTALDGVPLNGVDGTEPPTDGPSPTAVGDPDAGVGAPDPDDPNPGTEPTADDPDTGLTPDPLHPDVTLPPGMPDPTVTTPVGTLPDVPSGVPTPTVTTPDVTVPTVTTPGTTIPTVTTPGITIPTVTIPDVTIPTVTNPGITVPGVTVPDVTVPATTLPDVTVPPTTLPDVTVPGTTLPPVTVPATTLPPTTVPSTTMPPTTVPPTTLPPPTVPTTTVPGGLL